MFKKIFNRDSSKSDVPEKRVVPDFVENTETPSAAWITSQVFARGNIREYFAAYPQSPDSKRLDLYSFVYSGQESVSWNNLILGGYGVERIIQTIADLEKAALLDPKLSPVSRLKGNYREVANLHGMYFDDNDVLKVVDKNAPVTDNVMFSRKQLDALYSPAKDEPAAPVIATWDDYYREVVQKMSEWRMTPARFHDTVDSMKLYAQKVMDSSLPARERHAALSNISIPYQWNAYPATEGDRYQYGMAVLSTLMRAGSEVYSQFMAFPVASFETIQLLNVIRDKIETVARAQFDFSPEQAKQIADVIMTGPDPYADKPLPLEAFLGKKQSVQDAPKEPPVTDEGQWELVDESVYKRKKPKEPPSP